MTSRLLIVDDDAAMCDMLAVQLTKRGFDVTCFSDAFKALDAVLKEDFAVVLTDYHMSGMNGIELSARIAAHCPEVHVIVISSFGSTKTATAARRAGACDFITKPFETEVLVHAIHRAITHGGRVS